MYDVFIANQKWVARMKNVLKTIGCCGATAAVLVLVLAPEAGLLEQGPWACAGVGLFGLAMLRERLKLAAPTHPTSEPSP